MNKQTETYIELLNESLRNRNTSDFLITLEGLIVQEGLISKVSSALNLRSGEIYSLFSFNSKITWEQVKTCLDLLNLQLQANGNVTELEGIL